eukprot:TRINITY_DN6584_c0_g1_i1.p1 TRINITY_DN6584_c0_g1~~TRINITY_DN6584_c0_g1_i1.p1  ORF type:complete len:165 (+),score=27.12 TRINITY_DN6584_c0_g1_i1:469-963(+)
MVKFTDDSTESKTLKKASTLISDGLSQHNSKIDNDFMLQYMEVVQIKDSIEGLSEKVHSRPQYLIPQKNFPFSPSRILIDIYEVKVKHSEKSLSKLNGSKVYLFNDCILYTRKKGKAEEFVDIIIVKKVQDLSEDGGKVTVFPFTHHSQQDHHRYNHMGISIKR